MLVDFKTISETKNELLKQILSSKFQYIAAALKNVTKVASKGNRKGLLIFKPTAANDIYNIEDKFVQYIVRSIYDQYKDLIGGVIFRVHMNEIFATDFIKDIFIELSPNIKRLYNELKDLENYKKDEIDYNYKIVNKYSEYDSRNENNVFNKNNSLSMPYYNALNTLKEKVKREHPRVQDVKKYIDNDYYLRDELREITKNHQNSFSEYVEAYKNWTNLTNEKYGEKRKKSEEIKESMKSENLDTIKKEITNIIQEFITVITNSILQGIINL